MRRHILNKMILKNAGPAVLLAILLFSSPVMSMSGGEFELTWGGIGIAGESSGGEYSQVGLVQQIESKEITGGAFTAVTETFVSDCFYNIKPVADAGPDQALLELGTTVLLDGRGSWDDDGDDISYLWTMIELPSGSASVLDDNTSPQPTFVADVYGDYIIELVVNDLWALSDPDTVIVSFENIMPVADAGVYQAVYKGDTVYLDGSGSFDANFDELTYSWSFVSVPAGSSAVLSGSDTVNPSFVADEAGMYVVSLVVNDGFVDSEADEAEIMAITLQEGVTELLMEAVYAVNGLDSEDLKNEKIRRPLVHWLLVALEQVDEGLYAEAFSKLEGNVLPKVDGCVATGDVESNDWITDCVEQEDVYWLIVEAMGLLKELVGP